MEEQWNKMKVRPKAKSFAPVGIKVAATLSKITINAKIIDKKFHKPEAKSEVKLVKPYELDKLIDLLENEAKVI